jgi:hypothetical protein
MAEQADQTELPAGLSIADEIAFREQRLANLGQAKQVLEARARERYELEQAEYEAQVREGGRKAQASYIIALRQAASYARPSRCLGVEGRSSRPQTGCDRHGRNPGRIRPGDPDCRRPCAGRASMGNPTPASSRLIRASRSWANVATSWPARRGAPAVAVCAIVHLTGMRAKRQTGSDYSTEFGGTALAAPPGGGFACARVARTLAPGEELNGTT